MSQVHFSFKYGWWILFTNALLVNNASSHKTNLDQFHMKASCMARLPCFMYRIKLKRHCLSFNVATPLWGKCEVAIHTPENGTWKSSGIPKNSEFNCKGQNTSHWGVLYTIRKVSKCRCLKWPRMNHLDICSTSYGWKKGRESNW